MEHKVGEIITLEVVEVEDGTSCRYCFFNKMCNPENVNCYDSDRKDGKNIIYKEISRSEPTTCC